MYFINNIFIKMEHWSNSSTASNVIINLLVKNGEKQIKQNQTIKKNQHKYTNKSNHFMTNNLIEQSQKHCITNLKPINQQAKPKNIQSDNLICKSVSINKKVKLNKHRKLVSNRSVSTSKHINSNRSRGTKLSQQNLRMKMRKVINNQTYKLKVEPLNCPVQIQNEDDQQVKKINSMRKTWISQINEKQDEKVNQQDQIEEKNMMGMIKSRQSFKNKINNKNLAYTFDNNGNPLVFNKSNQAKSLATQFPITIAFQNKKGIGFRPNLLTSSKTISNMKLKSTSTKTKIIKDQNKTSQTLDNQSMEYSNNDCRQMTSLPFFRAEPGVCFTQPDSNEKLNIKNQPLERQECKSRMSSSFMKYDIRKNTSTNFAQSKLIDGRINKTQYLTDQFYSQFRPQTCQPSQKRKKRIKSAFLGVSRNSTKSNGTINQVNQNLLTELIV